MRNPYWWAGLFLLALTACSHKPAPQAADNSATPQAAENSGNPQAADNGVPGHVGSTQLTQPTPGNPSGVAPGGGTGGPTRNDTGAGSENGTTSAPGQSSQGAQH